MPRTPGRRPQLARAARRDLDAIAEWTIENFGSTAERRYSALIRRALRDIEANPDRLGSKQLPEGLRTYHIELSKARVIGSRVRDPRHIVLYRRCDDGIVEVLRILHDSRDIERHLPDESNQ